MHVRFCAILFANLIIAGPTIAQSGMAITSGHGGHWYDPARNGEGWVLELLDDDAALLYWFTYDEQGNQRWLTANGHIVMDGDGERIDFPTLVVTRGGRFGPDFDPADVERLPVGEASLRFSGCDEATFTYEAFGQSQTLALHRLVRAMGTQCESIHGMPGREVFSNAGLSGSWFDPDHNGEGYSLQWMSSGEALLTWYSYDGDGNQFWMLGVGRLMEGVIRFPQLHATRGARFGAAFDPNDVERFEWGTLALTLDCSGGSAHYVSVIDAFGIGTLALDRLTTLRTLPCPWQRPRLLDLYDISLLELPHDNATNNVSMSAMSDDGTVYGIDDEGRVYAWSPGETVIEAVHGGVPLRLPAVPPVFAAASGAFVIVNQMPLPAPDSFAPNFWRPEEGWGAIPQLDDPYSTALVLAISRDGSRIIGTGRGNNDPGFVPWIWTDGEGAVPLPLLGEDGRWQPIAVSDSGDVVIGNRWGTGAFMRPVPVNAVRSVDGAPAETIPGPDGRPLGPALASSADGRTLFGHRRAGPFFEDQRPWVRAPDGTLGEIVRYQDDTPPGPDGFYRVIAASADGSMGIGSYSAGLSTTDGAFIWTTLTGVERVPDLITALGLHDGEWAYMAGTAISSSGGRILLTGFAGEPGAAPPTNHRSAVLELVQREDIRR
jgi:hypothetical protein